MSNQLRLLADEPDTNEPGTNVPDPGAEGTVAMSVAPGSPARPRRRRGRGPSDRSGRIDSSTRRAGRQGVAAARRALLAATDAELRRAG